MFALDLDVLARVVGTSRQRLVSHLWPKEEEEAESEEDDDEEAARPRGGVAVITAARRPSKRKPKELLEIGGRPIIWHSLRALERSGFEAAVVLVGYRGQEIESYVRRGFHSETMSVEFVNVGEDWRGSHAASIVRARPALERLCGEGLSGRPALLVTSDHLFDPSLLEAMYYGVEDADALLVEGHLHDQLQEHLLPATAVRVRTSLFGDDVFGTPPDEESRGDQQKRGATFWCDRVGRRVDDHDAFDAGLARLDGPRVLDALERLQRRGGYFALCDALDVVARKGKLRAVFTENRPWVAIETDEQLEYTRVSLASPHFGAQVPIEVHYKETTPRRFAIVDDSSRFPTTVEFQANKCDDAVLVKVDPNDSEFVCLVPEEETPPDRPYANLLASTGIEDADDISRLGIRSTQDRRGVHLEVKVERQVPFVGWLVLVVATALQASNFLVYDAVKPPAQQLCVALWRSLAASAFAIPLVLARRIFVRASSADATPPPSVAGYAALALTVLGFWISASTYQMAFLFAASDNDVILLTSLAPIFVILARQLRVYGDLPTTNELFGTAIGLFGATLCAVFAPSTSSRPPNPNANTFLALFFSLVCVFMHASYSVTTKICRRYFSAPDIHIFMQLGAAFISLLVVCIVDAREGRPMRRLFSVDPDFGAFGLFSPKRLGAFVWCGLGVDTFGTFGYVVAVQYVDPLVTTVATLFQPLCAVFQSAFWLHTPLPSPNYLLGAAVLIGGSSLIATTGARTQHIINADAAVRRRPGQDKTKTPGDGFPHSTSSAALVALSDAARSTLRSFWHHTDLVATRTRAPVRASERSSLLPAS